MSYGTRKLLSERFAFVYFLRIWQKRLFRFLSWYFNKKTYSSQINLKKFSNRYKKHASKLIRKLSDDSREMQWQINKVTNLKIAASKINGLLIKPGETFSFCKTVGRPTKRKGYLEGMELSRGKAIPGIGGGLCQLSNLLNWLAWHTPLIVVERSHHSFDPFPDQGRVLPFGSGAAIFWNYVDLQIFNPTKDETFQIIVWVDSTRLRGEIRSTKTPHYEYSIFEQNQYFTKIHNEWFRSNEIWRKISEKGVGGEKQKFLKEELLARNFSKVCYEPDINQYQIK